MNLQDAWKELNLERPPAVIPKVLEATKRSRHPVQRLKRAYLISVILSIAFFLVFIILLFRFEEGIVRAGIIAMTAVYICFTWINIRAYRKVQSEIPMDGKFIIVLQETYDFIVANIRYQEGVGLFVYPFALASGYLMGLSAGSDNHATEEMTKPFVLVALLIAIILFTPLCWLLARWMYQKSFGPCLKELKALIQEAQLS